MERDIIANELQRRIEHKEKEAALYMGAGEFDLANQLATEIAVLERIQSGRAA